MRPRNYVQHLLQTARSYKESTRRPLNADPFVLRMRASNDAEIKQLEQELVDNDSHEGKVGEDQR